MAVALRFPCVLQCNRPYPDRSPVATKHLRPVFELITTAVQPSAPLFGVNALGHGSGAILSVLAKTGASRIDLTPAGNTIVLHGPPYQDLHCHESKEKGTDC